MTAPRFERDAPAPGPLVRGFAAGGFRIDGAIWPAALLTPDKAVAWDPPALADLTEAHVAGLLDSGPEFLLLGTGPVHLQPPRHFVEALEAKGIGIEAMDSRAAARAWGLLRGEGRRIVAALLPL